MANALLNMLQAASNSAASNVSAPVDGIAWLLRKAGIPIPENALGGSNWMQQQGLMAPVQQGAGQVAGETLGLLAGPVAALKAPQIAGGLLAAERNLAAPRTLNPQTGAIVWHGSPHKFDKFDSSKIGTGEGAQAYGHGLYLAESPDVAKSYRAALSDFGLPDGAPEKGIATLISARGEEGERMARQAYKNLGPARLEEAIQKAKTHMGANSSLYKVDLPDEKIARMLDWDKPLSQQAPEVRAALDRMGLGAKETGQAAYKAAAGFDSMANVAKVTLSGGRDPEQALRMVFPKITDSEIKTAIARAKSSSGDSIASSMLRDAGIPGIRYLDGGSRGAGTGSSNFVVFPGEENALSILERNGGLLR